MNKENPVAAFSVQETMFGREYRIESTSGRLPYGFSNLMTGLRTARPVNIMHIWQN